MQRLLKRADFLAAAASGTKWVRPAFVVQLGPQRDPQNEPRIGFTVTKKQGNAVRRNRIRRRLKEAARGTLPALVKHGYDYVIIGRQAAFDMPFEQLKLELSHAVTKVHTLKPR